MVCDNTEGVIGFVVKLRGEFFAGHFSKPVDYGHKQVCVVIAAFILQDGRNSFQSSAGIDVFGIQRREFAVFCASELYKNEIPKLDESCAAGVYGAFVAGDIFLIAAVWAEVDVDFAAWAAGAGFTHFPEVIFSAEFEDAVGGKGRYFCPERRSNAIFGEIIVGIAGKNGGV